jgi:nitroimidazol reductase NimA-like FMN-containing flavoprotein (pyridoxamine 5'-phosphate oxidase superfamily)
MKRTACTEAEIKAFEPSEKIAAVATIRDGLPHISLLTSLMAQDATHFTIGEFCRGSSKENMENNKRIAFAILTLDRRLWLGKAVWTHKAREGREYEIYNAQPMFRYNTYFGINTVHYVDLVEVEGGEKLPMGTIIKSAILTKIAKSTARAKREMAALKPFAVALFNQLDSLSFLAYIGHDGFPEIVPLFQAQAADIGKLVFHIGAYRDNIAMIPKGSTAAVYCVSMQMESVLVRGRYNGISRSRGMQVGTLDIDWVYNSLPSAHGQIYPELPLEAVTEF